jgi:ketosteroid isomerase-like protein
VSQENVELVRRALEAFNLEGAEAIRNDQFVAPDAVFDPTPAGIPGVEVIRGRDETATFFEKDWFKVFPFEQWELHIEKLIDNGDQVVALTRQRGRGASSGVTAELPLGNCFTVRNGQIVHMVIYREWIKALEAAGLSD